MLSAAEKWDSLGPAVFGACFAPSFNPHNPSEMMFGTDMGALFLTRDGGRSWQTLGSENKGGNPGYRGAWKTCFDPRVKNRLWVVSEHGVFRSDNGGNNWKKMTPSGTPLGYYLLSFAPGSSNIIYTGQGFNTSKPWQNGRLWRSADAGKTWQKIGSPDTTDGAGYTDMIVFSNEKKLILCGQRGIWESFDKGRTWRSLLKRFPFPKGGKARFTSLLHLDGKVFAMVIPFKVKGKVYGGLWVSADEGKSWKESSFNTYAKKMMNRSYHSTASGYMLAGTGKRIYLAINGFGVSRSDDAGVTWKQTLKSGAFWRKHNGSYFPSAKADTNIKGGTTYGTDAMRAIAVNPADPDMVMFTDNSSVTLSIDGGKTWTDPIIDYVYPFHKGRFGAEVPTQLSWAIRSRGPQVINCNKMARDPHDRKIMYAAYWDHGLHVSRDGGRSWERPSRGLITYDDLRGARSFTTDPKHPGRVYFTSCNPQGRAFVSNDYGVTFKNISVNRTPEKKREENKEEHSGIVIDPQDSKHLFMTTDIGLFESKDGGANWKDITPSQVRKYPRCRLFVINRTGWFLGIAENQRLPVSGLYFSGDKGKSWKRIMPDDIGGVVAIKFCHSAPKTGYLIAHDPGKSGTWSETTLYKTTDGGLSWKGIYGPELLNGLAVHPTNPNAVYIARYVRNLNNGHPGYLYSENGGKSFRVISRDIPIVGRVCDIVITPQNPGEVFFCDFFTVYRLSRRP